MGKLKRHNQAAVDRKVGAATLGQLVEYGVPVFCWCNRCSHHATIDSGFLAGRLGPQFAVPEIGSTMRCTGCGSKNVATRPEWPSPLQSKELE